MSLLSAISVALGALLVHKGRTFLTSLGIIIGIGSVIAMVSAGNGVEHRLQQQLASVGTRLIVIRAGARLKSGAIADLAPLTRDDAAALRKQLGHLLAGVAEIQLSQHDTSSRFETRTSVLCGTVPEIRIVRDWPIAIGRYFTDEEVTRAAPVCVLGDTVRRKLFPDDPAPLGKVVRVGRLTLHVVGVLTLKGRSPTGADQDDEIFVPVTTLQRKIVGEERVNVILATVPREDQLERAVEEVKRVLRGTHRLKPGKEDFDASSVKELSQLGYIVLGTVNLLVAVIASLSLLVGGIGIMNIMLVSVTERTREIGIRMALGATPGDVLGQFLIEAMILALLGGLLGIIAGVSVAVALAWAVGWPLVLSPGIILLAVTVSAGVGVFFGFFPAWRAAQLDPIEALRHE